MDTSAFFGVIMADIKEGDLIDRVRQRADMENNFFVSDDEVQTYINAGIAELHDILIQTYGQDYYVKSKEFTTSSGVDSYPINDSTSTNNIGMTDFYKVRGVDCKVNGQEWFTLRPFNFNEKRLYKRITTFYITKYRLYGYTNLFICLW